MRNSFHLQSILLNVLLAFTLLVNGYSYSRPCGFKTKVSILSRCKTASAFCSSYLGGSAPYTRTIKETSYVRPVRTITLSDSTTVVVISTSTSVSTSTSTTTKTVRHTTLEPKCKPTVRAVRREASAAQVTTPLKLMPGKSCGLARDADPFKVSGACNCYIGHTTTTTLTRTRSRPSNTRITETHTIKSTSTKTVTSTSVMKATATQIKYYCEADPNLPKKFTLRFDAPLTPYDNTYLARKVNHGAHEYAASVPRSEADIFVFNYTTNRVRRLIDDTPLQQLNSESPNFPHQVLFGPRSNNPDSQTPIDCVIDAATRKINCNGPYGSSFAQCGTLKERDLVVGLTLSNDPKGNCCARCAYLTLIPEPLRFGERAIKF